MILINPLVGIHFTVPFLQQKKKKKFFLNSLSNSNPSLSFFS